MIYYIFRYFKRATVITFFVFISSFLFYSASNADNIHLNEEIIFLTSAIKKSVLLNYDDTAQSSFSFVDKKLSCNQVADHDVIITCYVEYNAISMATHRLSFSLLKDKSIIIDLIWCLDVTESCDVAVENSYLFRAQSYNILMDLDRRTHYLMDNLNIKLKAKQFQFLIECESRDIFGGHALSKCDKDKNKNIHFVLDLNNQNRE